MARLAPAILCGAGLGVFAGLGMGPVDAMPFFLPAAVLLAMVLRTDLGGRRAWIALGVALATCLGVAILIKLPTLLALAEHARLSHRAAWRAPIGFSEALRLHAAGRLRFLVSFWPLTLLTVRSRRACANAMGGSRRAHSCSSPRSSWAPAPVRGMAPWATRAYSSARSISRASTAWPPRLLLAGFPVSPEPSGRPVPVTGNPGQPGLSAVFSFVAGIAPSPPGT
ncbi:MAG: hypothetical protein U1F87_05845 [Kiritimatiellia bacterium]